LFGIDFPNPVGLAAGLDKNARLVKEFSSLGFGFVEIGTVTALPQKGNPKKRLFRIVDQEAIINRMGFNNDGVKKIAKRLRKKGKIIVGGNIGKNKNTTFEDTISDYLISFDNLFDYVDYFAVNVSSPNTENLRDLQHQENLRHLLNKLQQNNK
jgi:dihydroorotate dehydrogenase